MLPADPPQSLKGLAFNAPDGKPMTLADRAGKTVLLNLWATWCFPCREEMPALDALQKELGSEKFEVIAVNVDTGDDAKPKKFLAETGIDDARLLPRQYAFAVQRVEDARPGARPAGHASVDADGCLLAHMNGPADWASDDAKRLIAAATGGGG